MTRQGKARRGEARLVQARQKTRQGKDKIATTSNDRRPNSASRQARRLRQHTLDSFDAGSPRPISGAHAAPDVGASTLDVDDPTQTAAPVTHYAGVSTTAPKPGPSPTTGIRPAGVPEPEEWITVSEPTPQVPLLSPPPGQLLPPQSPAPPAPPAQHAGAYGSWEPATSSTPPAQHVSALAPASTSASASTPGAQPDVMVETPLLLTREDIPTYRGTFCHKWAHQWLKTTREDLANQGVELRDLSDSIYWRVYVCSHPKAPYIIGSAGIVRFEGRFLQGKDPNAHQLNLPEPYGKRRFDFVAVHADGYVRVFTLAPKRTRSSSWGGTSHG